MAVHKVPQDVEADDKFLGPLTFKQFLFAGGVVVFGYLSFLTITKAFVVSPIFIVPTLGFAALAFPWSKEQPTELWLAARIRFFLKPRRRIWDQSGVKELVTITAPVRPAHTYTDGLSQTEVRSRLSALATMVDSRGWASKNSNQNLTISKPVTEDSDRLVAPLAEEVDEKTATLHATVDVLDPTQGSVAQNLDSMIKKSEQERKEHTQEVLEKARKKAEDQTQSQDFWFMNQSQQAPTVVAPAQTQGSQPTATAAAPIKPVSQITKADEEALLDKVHEKQHREELQAHSSHEKVIQPAGMPAPAAAYPPAQPQQPTTAAQPVSQPKPVAQQPAPTPQPATQPEPAQPQAQQTPVNPQANPDIMQLSTSNDLNIETIARQANKNEDDGEVVISLH